MRQLLGDILFILLTTLAALLFIPFTFILAISAACREYSRHLSKFMLLEKQEEEYKHEQVNTW